MIICSVECAVKVLVSVCQHRPGVVLERTCETWKGRAHVTLLLPNPRLFILIPKVVEW